MNRRCFLILASLASVGAGRCDGGDNVKLLNQRLNDLLAPPTAADEAKRASALSQFVRERHGDLEFRIFTRADNKPLPVEQLGSKLNEPLRVQLRVAVDGTERGATWDPLDPANIRLLMAE